MVFGMQLTKNTTSVQDVKTALNSMVQARVGKIADIDPDADPLARLDSLFRMDAIKKKLEMLKKVWAVERREGNCTPNLGHIVFTGSPGK